MSDQRLPDRSDDAIRTALLSPSTAFSEAPSTSPSTSFVLVVHHSPATIRHSPATLSLPNTPATSSIAPGGEDRAFSQIPGPTWEQLAAIYEMRGDPALRAFFAQHPFLVALVREAYLPIREAFGSEVRPALAMSEVIEGEEEQELYLLIPTQLGPDEALDRLARLDEIWWLDVAPRAKGLLVINVDYR